MSDIPIIGSNKPTRQFLIDKGDGILPAQVKKENLSGLDDDTVVGWDKFLQAFFKDHPRGLNAMLVQALQSFILQWTFIGRSSHTMEVDLGGEEKDEDVQLVEVPGMPNFTYNRDNVKSIDKLFLKYGEWKAAVGDLKVNLAGSSHGEEIGKHEHKHWGGPVNVDDEPLFLNDGTEDLEKVFGL